MHFAANSYIRESVLEPREYFRNNVAASLSLLNAVLDAGIKVFVFSSTCAVYGTPKQVPISEDAPRHPINPYGSAKLFIENALEAYGQAYGICYACLRYFNAAGADESGDIGELHEPEAHLVPLTLAACTDNGAELQVYGTDYPTADGTCVRDYIHVTDLADAHVRALQHLQTSGKSVALNLGTGRGHSVLEVIEAAERITGAKVRRRNAPRRIGDPPTLVADPSLAQAMLQWKANRNMYDMVSSAWSWMQKSSGHFHKIRQ
jgi:UDP-glucose-4-epimerase GalE